MKNTCYYCRFFSGQDCRKRGPVAVGTDIDAWGSKRAWGASTAVWPHVRDDDWCGEWELTKDENRAEKYREEKRRSNPPMFKYETKSDPFISAIPYDPCEHVWLQDGVCQNCGKRQQGYIGP